MSKTLIPPAIAIREAAFKKKLAKQQADPLGAVPNPSAPVPTVQMSKIIDPLRKGSK